MGDVGALPFAKGEQAICSAPIARWRPALLAQAGPAAEGFEAVFPYDPRWLDFNRLSS